MEDGKMSNERMLKEKNRKTNSEKLTDLSRLPSIAIDSKSNVVGEEKIMQQDVSRMVTDTKKKRFAEAVEEDKLAIQAGARVGPKLEGLERQRISKQNLSASKKGFKELKKMKGRSKKQSKYEKKASNLLEKIDDEL
jgi:hypothetical protein